MLALFRAGRQSDALAVYRELSRLLREELGLEPSSRLQALELAILQRDPSVEPRSGVTRRSVTILLTDLEGCGEVSEQRRHVRDDAFERHKVVLRDAVEACNGQVVMSPGNRVMAALFASPVDGVGACVKAQQRFAEESLGEIGPLRVRMALHVGEAVMREGGYFGPTLSRAERILSAAHGRQVLLSAAAAARVAEELVNGYTLRDLGEHQLKDSGRAERVFQLVHPGLEVDFPPLVTRSRRASDLPEPASSFVGRGAELSEIAELLDDESVRLLTLSGPGGVEEATGAPGCRRSARPVRRGVLR